MSFSIRLEYYKKLITCTYEWDLLSNDKINSYTCDERILHELWIKINCLRSLLRRVIYTPLNEYVIWMNCFFAWGWCGSDK